MQVDAVHHLRVAVTLENAAQLHCCHAVLIVVRYGGLPFRLPRASCFAGSKRFERQFLGH
jgi:hypothetical protein